MKNENKLGAYLKEVRNNKGLSLRDVGAETGISASYISRVEKGERKQISTTMLRKFSDFYQVPILELYKIAGINTEVQSQSVELMAIDTEYVSIDGLRIKTEGFKHLLKRFVTVDVNNTKDIIKLVGEIEALQTYAQEE